MKNFSKKYLHFVILAAIAALVIGFSSKDKDSAKLERYYNLQHERSSATTEIGKLVESKKSSGIRKTVNVFTKSTGDNINVNKLNSFVDGAVTLTLDMNMLVDLRNNGGDNINFVIPTYDNSNVELELTKVDVVSDEFTLSTLGKNGTVPFSYKKGAYYRGVVKGKEKSLAAISIFDGHLMGVISDQAGNYVLGTVKDNENKPTANYIFYNDANMKVESGFKCGIEGYESKLIDEQVNEHHLNYGQSDAPAGPVKIYFQADYQTYFDANFSLQAVGDYITGLFNVTATIYQNESIPMEINNIQVWTSLDPFYWIEDSYEILKAFSGTIKNNWSGHIAHLISTRPEGLGGIANIRSLCKPFNQADSSGSYCFSNIETSYENWPTYSWTVMVVTHEMGHNMGSRHTHACIWPKPNGSVGPIDTCVVTGENLAPPNGIGCLPSSVNPNGYRAVGTIMSYCHFQQSAGGGINLALGFGSLPGDTIRLRYTQASCLVGISQIGSEVPAKYNLAQNYPNPFNPMTTIRFNIPELSKVKLEVFDITGRVIATLVNDQLAAGSYSYDLDASAQPSGVYFYRLQTDNFMEVKKMMLIK